MTTKERNEIKRRAQTPTKQYLYHDGGCHHHPSCLNCPLVNCIHDSPMEIVLIKIMHRRNNVRELLQQGMTARQIAMYLKQNYRTISRDIVAIKELTEQCLE